ncbi:ATP-binding cassette domain-containing protein [Flavobacterium succinicans]|uniref:Lipopolysaccharide export system ATP-binding protein LptB n=1 Tax=Flavobacterium succinicans TaxID=29536 RepID=A0A199XQS8_9FLAO|nr:ATP-binding cassette domain-containing protein [Flavobacterium succinicans]OAZ03679.1 lipopolysaccharide export system ATP-binding protein LptB [Flavobacterium succinicans]
MKHVLEIDSIQKKFDLKPILSDVYLKCETGDIIGLLGRNGSGKSTLLQIIFGVLKADFKFIRVDGVVKSKTSELFNEICYLSQDNFLPKNFTVAQVIALSIKKNEISAFYNDEMITTLQNKNIGDLSSGELRYLEIKLVLNNSSKFVLLDEPYNGLSPLLIEKINDLILKSAVQKGIIITDHNYESIIGISTRLTLLKESKLHHIKNKEELVEKGYLSR